MLLLAMEEMSLAQRSDIKLDEGLLPRVAAGDQSALETIYLQTHRAVHALVLSILRDPYETQDIVQETFLKVRAAAHLYSPQGKPLAWIFTIAKNLARSQLRNRERTQEAPGGMEDDLRFSSVSDPTDRLILQAALKTLGEEERQVVLLHAVSGLRHREIAQSMGLPLSTVLSRYHRALKKLQKHLTEEGVHL